MAGASASSHNLATPAPDRNAYSERALTVRRPSSVSARSNMSRRYRSHRSMPGGSSHNIQNEFPNFALSGDVEILVNADGQERRYLLHRLILAQNSGFFDASTSEQWSRAQAQTYAENDINSGALSVMDGKERDGDYMRSSLDKARPKMTWRYELDWGPDGRSDDIPMLVQKPVQQSLFGGDQAPKPPPSRNKPPPSSTGLFRSIAAMQTALHISSSRKEPSPEPDSDTIRDYDNLFRIFYNYAPRLDSIDITEAYIQCKMLLNLADMYDALEVVGPRVDHHLLQFQGRLWKQIAKYPPSYLRLGYLARSRSIFAEALVHVVGQWPLGANQLRGMPDAVIDLIEDKAADLDELQARTEAALLKLSLTSNRGERVAPFTNFLEWSAVALFHSWIADNTVPVPLPVKVPPASSSTNGTASQLSAPPSQPSAPAPSNPTGSALVRTSNAVTTPTAAVLRAPLVPSISGAPPGTPPVRAPARTFRLLGQGGSAYLGHDECKRFVRLLPDSGSRDALRRFERRIDALKLQARELVRPLLWPGLQLEGGGLGGIGGVDGHVSRLTDAAASGAMGFAYLTCTRINDGEWPW